jgi:hypothetical protein
VLELFDKSPDGSLFTDEDQRLASAAANMGSEMLRQAMGERQMHRVLFDAVEAALGASDSLAGSLSGASAALQEKPPPRAVLDSLKEGLTTAGNSPAEAEETVKLAEAIRVLALRHGTPALNHCLTLIQNLRGLLDQVTESS